ncbi:MAG: hypothetical protein RJB38_808 [Pseudomonadota bacterium]|jgi:hypothetical protein
MDQTRLIHWLGWLVGFLMVVATARADSSFEHYGARRFAKVLPQVRLELSRTPEDSHAYWSRVRLATQAFASDARIPWSELSLVYAAARLSAKKFGYLERLTAEEAAVRHWCASPSSISADAARLAIDQALRLPARSTEEVRQRSAELFALNLLARRKVVSGSTTNNPWIELVSLTKTDS